MKTLTKHIESFSAIRHGIGSITVLLEQLYGKIRDILTVLHDEDVTHKAISSELYTDFVGTYQGDRYTSEQYSRHEKYIAYVNRSLIAISSAA
jgi:hypothetical protein